MPASKKKSSKRSTTSTVGMSRGRRGMFLRISPELYEKLCRMSAIRFAKGHRGGIQGTVIKLIEQADDGT